MQASEMVEVTGHLIDSGILPGCLNDIKEYDGDYAIDRFEVGHEQQDLSYAKQLARSSSRSTALAAPRHFPGLPYKATSQTYACSQGVSKS